MAMAEDGRSPKNGDALRKVRDFPHIRRRSRKKLRIQISHEMSKPEESRNSNIASGKKLREIKNSNIGSIARVEPSHHAALLEFDTNPTG
jgi:hypothetical protein